MESEIPLVPPFLRVSKVFFASNVQLKSRCCFIVTIKNGAARYLISK